MSDGDGVDLDQRISQIEHWLIETIEVHYKQLLSVLPFMISFAKAVILKKNT